jgi:hypothetical protein
MTQPRTSSTINSTGYTKARRVKAMTPINLVVLKARHSRLIVNTVETNITFLLFRVGRVGIRSVLLKYFVVPTKSPYVSWA